MGSPNQKLINKLAIETFYEANEMMLNDRLFIGTINPDNLTEVKRLRQLVAEQMLQELTIDETKEMINGAIYLYSLGERLVKEGKEF